MTKEAPPPRPIKLDGEPLMKIVPEEPTQKPTEPRRRNAVVVNGRIVMR